MSTSSIAVARLLEERRGRVLLLTISNPSARNAMSPDLYRAAAPVFRKAAVDAGVGAIVLAGEGEHFCGGGNLNRLRAQRGLPAAEQAGQVPVEERQQQRRDVLPVAVGVHQEEDPPVP